MDPQVIANTVTEMLSNPPISPCLPFALAFIVGYIMGLADFTRHFTDSFKEIASSLACVSYCIVNGLLVSMTLSIINITNLQILNIKFSEHQYALAILVGIIGYTTILTRMSNKDSDDENISSTLLKTLLQTQKIFFERYTINREIKLRPQVDEIMSSVDENLLMGISDTCTIIARNLDDHKTDKLAERFINIYSSTMPIKIKKIEIGLEHVKNIGLLYFKQVVDEFKNSSSLTTSIGTVEKKILELQEINNLESEND